MSLLLILAAISTVLWSLCRVRADVNAAELRDRRRIAEHVRSTTQGER